MSRFITVKLKHPWRVAFRLTAARRGLVHVYFRNIQISMVATEQNTEVRSIDRDFWGGMGWINIVETSQTNPRNMLSVPERPRRPAPKTFFDQTSRIVGRTIDVCAQVAKEESKPLYFMATSLDGLVILVVRNHLLSTLPLVIVERIKTCVLHIDGLIVDCAIMGDIHPPGSIVPTAVPRWVSYAILDEESEVWQAPSTASENPGRRSHRLHVGSLLRTERESYIQNLLSWLCKLCSTMMSSSILSERVHSGGEGGHEK